MATYQYRDQLSIDTPEQVALNFPIAGLGSRILAQIADVAILVAVYLIISVLILLAFAGTANDGAKQQLSDRQGMWLTAGFVFLNFLFVWGYYTLFEAFWNGQTPGKRLNRIRVIKDTGRQITLFESMTRNFLRIIDMMPGAYIVGVVTILFSKQNKRLGDLLAGTIVVRQEILVEAAYSTRSITVVATPTPAQTVVDHGIELDQATIAKLSANDLVMIEAFFARVPDLDPQSIDRIAMQMLQILCRKMEIEVPTSVSPRRALDAIAYSLREVSVFRG